MKKIVSIILTSLLLVSTIGFSASALSFSDLAESHWAYSDVQTLVSDGTVGGYADGTFRPNGTVTRAEFVKMLGFGTKTREKEYSDVSSAHWAYEYIMKSDFPDDGSNTFAPDKAITRGLVAELLWNRGGKNKTAFAPAMITRQYSKNNAAVAWVYETGLIKGDDGVNLRLDDTLSRAEAAVLIIRARKVSEDKTTFADTVSHKILENVYNGLNLFDGKAFSPDDTMTNGEMARAVLRIGTEETNLSYSYLNTSAGFEHAYARDLAAVCNTCLGKDKLTAAFADKKAGFGDTVAALVYQFIYKANTPVMYGAKTGNLPAGINDMMNICLTYAKDHGVITLKEDLTAPITVREFISLCILMDDVIGSQTDITTDINPATSRPIGVDHALFLTETPYGDYRVKLKDMPSAVYSTPAVARTNAPVEDYNFAREYAGVFTDMLAFMDDSVYNRSGADVRLTYYPSLAWKNTSGGYSMRIRCDVVEMEGTKAFNELFVMGEGATGGDTKLSQGSTVWFDVATGQSATSIFITDEKAYVEQVVCLS